MSEERVREYISRSDKELKELALGILNRSVYTSMDVPEGHGMEMVFMVLALMTKEQKEDLLACEPFLFYEEISKSMPRSINGQPSFLSVKFINKVDYERMRVYLKELAEYMGMDTSEKEK